MLYFFIGMFLLPYGLIGKILFTLTALVGMVGIVREVIAALGLSLILFFLIGSSFFWMGLNENTLLQNETPYLHILIWMFALLILSITTGQISLEIKTLKCENDSLREQMRTLVSVDPDTGFDNKERLIMELKLEFNRSKRYGHTFTLLLIKINHLDQFEKLYGETELTELLQHLTKSMYRYTRVSDHKFRPEKDIFALLLTDTLENDVEIVIDKLNKELPVFRLSNKKYISLTLSYGYICYSEDINNHQELYKLAKEQVSHHVA